MSGARQSRVPVQFQRMARVDETALMSSGEVGVVTPAAYIPLLRGDSASGSFAIDLRLAEMPRPLLNGVMMNVQAWFVPKSADPRFGGYDEFMAAYNGTTIEKLGQDTPDEPVDYFYVNRKYTTETTVRNDPLSETLGLHLLPDESGDHKSVSDVHDAFSLAYNFRLAAHSNKLERRLYEKEVTTASQRALPPAFWPTGNRSGIVPDYERALVVGALDLDVTAGHVPLKSKKTYKPYSTENWQGPLGDNDTLMNAGPDGFVDWGEMIFADMEGQTVPTSLADIDKARETQAFARLRAAMQGNDATGFMNEDAIMAELMSGLRVPDDEFRRPWLLDQKRVAVGMTERPATDGASLDMSVTTGQASASLRLNVPQQDTGGIIIITCEVLPERVDEAMADPFLTEVKTPEDLPDPLRDVQRTEPVDMVKNSRIDARHTTPDGLYGFEPMNDKWNRRFTRLGGSFLQETPGTAWTEQRSGIWHAEIVDPTFTDDHFLAPVPFPKYVFADQTAPAFEFVARHNVAISGLTQIGDVLYEDNDDYAAIEEGTDNV